MRTESKLEPGKMEPQTDLEQATKKDEESIICNRQSRLRYVLMIIAAVCVIGIITLGFYLGNKFK